jgi:GWxTD domain-containing protein
MPRSIPAILLALCALATVSTAETDHERVRDALRALDAGDTTSTIELLERSDLEGLDDPVLFMLLGRLYRERGTIRDRLRSYEVLERARALYVDHPGVLNELGLTQYARTFYPDAVRYFKKVDDLNPRICEGKYKIAVAEYEAWKSHVFSYWDDAGDARAWLKVFLACDSTNVDAAVRYANVLYGLERTDEAVAAAEKYGRIFPDNPTFPLIVGSVAFDEKRYAAADSAYHHALTLMTPAERSAYTRLGRTTLSYEDLDIYEDVDPPVRKIIDRGYWINADWDPTTERNEILLEHMHRTFRADIFFSAAKPHIMYTTPQRRGWDTERGEVSIKFGWPTNAEGAYGGYRWERWNYVFSNEIINFNFTDNYLNNRYQIARGGSSILYVRHHGRVTRVEPEWTDIDGAMDVVTFKDSDLQASAYVLLNVNADSVRAHVDVRNESFNLRARFFREDWTTDAFFADELDVMELAVLPGSIHTLYDVIRRYPVPFGRYHVACAFDDDGRRVNAQFRGGVDPSRFAGDQLQASDILLERAGDHGATMIRGERLLRPNPWRAYAHGQMVRAYFEVYNLAVRDGRSHYYVTYTINANPAEEPGAWNRLGHLLTDWVTNTDEPTTVAQTIERTGTRHDEGEAIAIDVDTLPEGWYRLVVTVADVYTGAQVETDKIFFKAAPDLVSDAE